MSHATRVIEINILKQYFISIIVFHFAMETWNTLSPICVNNLYQLTQLFHTFAGHRFPNQKLICFFYSRRDRNWHLQASNIRNCALRHNGNLA